MLNISTRQTKHQFMKKPSLMARFTTSTAMQRDTLRTSDNGGYSRPFFNCSSSTKFARARTLATTMPLVTCLAPASDAPRPSPGKMYLHCATDQQTRNKREREVKLTCCCLGLAPTRGRRPVSLDRMANHSRK